MHLVFRVQAADISIHALREEGDFNQIGGLNREKDFYPRPPRGGRLQALYFKIVPFLISIHALREEGDITSQFFSSSSMQFLSTPSARRATPCPDQCRPRPEISIHALREEGDRR